MCGCMVLVCMCGYAVAAARQALKRALAEGNSSAAVAEGELEFAVWRSAADLDRYFMRCCWC